MAGPGKSGSGPVPCFARTGDGLRGGCRGGIRWFRTGNSVNRPGESGSGRPNARASGAVLGDSGPSVVPGPVSEGIFRRMIALMGCSAGQMASLNPGIMIIPVIQCQITHRKQSRRRYNRDVLCGAALGVGLIQGIGLNPRGTHMRFVSTRWSLSAAGLLSALALAACSQPAPAPAPAPAPVVTTAPPMAAPVMTHRHSRAWYKRHHKHRKM
jgi:hypothetical protein